MDNRKTNTCSNTVSYSLNRYSNTQVKQQRKALTHSEIQQQVITAAIITGACLPPLRSVDKSLRLSLYFSCTEAEASSE